MVSAVFGDVVIAFPSRHFDLRRTWRSFVSSHDLTQIVSGRRERESLPRPIATIGAPTHVNAETERKLSTCVSVTERRLSSEVPSHAREIGAFSEVKVPIVGKPLRVEAMHERHAWIVIDR